MIDYDFFVIGRQLKKFRESKSLSQLQLSKLTGISNSYLSDLERGVGTKDSTISIDKICKLATILDVRLDDFACTNLELKSYSENQVISEILIGMDSLSDRDIELFLKFLDIIVEASKK